MIPQQLDLDAAIEQVAESFVTRYRAGERPSVSEYAERYPQLAAQLEGLLPALILLEKNALAFLSNSSRSLASALAPPATVGEFTIVREIGRGGMGVVYEAVQQSLHRHVALKILPSAAHLNPKHLERFRYEAMSAARLHHHGIVPVFEVGERDGLHYYAMQFIQGQSLQGVIELLRNGPRNEDVLSATEDPAGLCAAHQTGHEFYRKVARIGRQVCDALAYAHSEGVLHRDIKPSNLLLDSKGDVWITDFGLAKIEGVEGLTETGDFIGTLRYMAPERLEGAYDRRSDIYGLGATLYELITLHAAFGTESRARLVDNILHHAPALPSKLVRSVPRDLETIVLRAMAKEPAARYRCAEEMAEDLQRFLDDRPILSRRSTAAERAWRWCRQNRMITSLATVAATLLVAAVAILAYSNSRIRGEAAARERAIVSARGAVHQLLTQVASDKLEGIPLSHPLRVSLFEDAARAYEQLLVLGDTDRSVQLELANVLHSIAGLQRELDEYGEAADALKRSAALYQSLVETDQNPPSIRETLATVETDLAYTWQFDMKSLHRESFPVEAQYRRSLELYEAIEQEYPRQYQPVTLCLSSLAKFAYGRGDNATAERFWRQAISRGELYLDRRPDHIAMRTDLCWACIDYYEAILQPSKARQDEAREVLAQGVRHAERLCQEHPEYTAAVDVLAALHFRQALAQCRAGAMRDAVRTFRLAVGEIETLCESVPWNIDFWNSARWFHEESIRNLAQSGQTEDLNDMIAHVCEWLGQFHAKTTVEGPARKNAHEAALAFAKVLHSIDRDDEAEQLIAKIK